MKNACLSNCFKNFFGPSLIFFGLTCLLPIASGNGCRYWTEDKSSLLRFSGRQQCLPGQHWANRKLWQYGQYETAFELTLACLSVGLLTWFLCCANLIHAVSSWFGVMTAFVCKMLSRSIPKPATKQNHRWKVWLLNENGGWKGDCWWFGTLDEKKRTQRDWKHN